MAVMIVTIAISAVGETGTTTETMGGSFDLRQTALNAGYNEGMKTARRRGRRVEAPTFKTKRLPQATKDYSSRLGSRDLYSRYFREAYETGFNDGFYPAATTIVATEDWTATTETGP